MTPRQNIPSAAQLTDAMETLLHLIRVMHTADKHHHKATGRNLPINWTATDRAAVLLQGIADRAQLGQQTVPGIAGEELAIARQAVVQASGTLEDVYTHWVNRGTKTAKQKETQMQGLAAARRVLDNVRTADAAEMILTGQPEIQQALFND